MNKKNILFVFISLLISSAVFLVGYQKTSKPIELYRVYLKGETIGYIKNKELLEEYIDKKQTEIKEKYGVEKVYLPNDLDIKKEITYGKNVSTEKQIYEYIKNVSPFTIEGYKIVIHGFEEMTEESSEAIIHPDVKIYVLDKSIFEKALKATVNVFISEKDYNNFINKTQPEIKDVGSTIEDIYIKNKITIKEERVSTEEKIYTNVDDLSKFLLYGSNKDQEKYTVKSGESISDVALKNRLSVEEFLIVNPEFSSSKNLLYEGEVVNVGAVSPQFTVIEEDHTVELQTEVYETKVVYDDSIVKGYEVLKQNGTNGIAKITKKVQKENGSIVSTIITKREVVTPSVPKIIAKGTLTAPKLGNVGIWGWPTIKPYTISSGFGYRKLVGKPGKPHEGIDIVCSFNSPIYAANNGTVEVARNDKPWPNGNYVIINHNNGFYSLYAHLNTATVVPGQVVSMGQQIGTMGWTGNVVPRSIQGTHLHFSISIGFPYRGTYQFYPPLDFYKWWK